MTALESRSLLAGAVGLALFVIGLLVEPRQALTSYLFAYAAVLTVVLGALIQLMMSHVSGARWFTVLRRLTLSITGAMPVLVILAIPLFVGLSAIYSWTAPSALAPAARAIVEHKSGWLNVPFFVVRGVVYLTVWFVVAGLLRRRSLSQDTSGNSVSFAATRRLRRLSALGLIAVCLTLTLASFDWLMSLEPTWYSTIYGIYVLAGGFLAALGLIAVLARAASTAGQSLDGVVTREHFGSLGKLLLTFVIFWAYIGFSQLLIIWLGDLPLDASWYVTRTAGSWGVLALVIVAGQFALPLMLLLSRPFRRRPDFMAALGWCLLLMHVLDVYWLVLPALHPRRLAPSWLDAAALVMVAGFATAAAAWRARGRALIPRGDPYLAGAIKYVEP